MTLHTLPPLAGAAALLPPIDRETRKTLEAYVDHLIAVLDALDGDPDLEVENEHGDGNSDDEPSLGSLAGTAPTWSQTPSWSISQMHWAGGNRTDAEQDGSDFEDGGDDEIALPDEPSLGSLDAQPNQELWGDHHDGVTWNITDGEKDDSDLEDVDGGGF